MTIAIRDKNQVAYNFLHYHPCVCFFNHGNGFLTATAPNNIDFRNQLSKAIRNAGEKADWMDEVNFYHQCPDYRAQERIGFYLIIK